MHSYFNRAIGLAAALLVVVVSACGGDTTGTEDTGAETGFGEPADATEADRTIDIIASDDFTFDPDEITVSTGEAITFRVTNEGVVPHDFVLGDEATQDEHEEEMAEMEGMEHEEANAVTLDAGETKEITWRFSAPGTVLIGCHEPGHYDAGMKGAVTVES